MTPAPSGTAAFLKVLPGSPHQMHSACTPDGVSTPAASHRGHGVPLVAGGVLAWNTSEARQERGGRAGLQENPPGRGRPWGLQDPDSSRLLTPGRLSALVAGSLPTGRADFQRKSVLCLKLLGCLDRSWLWVTPW